MSLEINTLITIRCKSITFNRYLCYMLKYKLMVSISRMNFRGLLVEYNY